MLIALDNFISALAAPVAQGATSITLVDQAPVCAAVAASGNYTYLRVSDGTRTESVRVTSCQGGAVQLAAPVANSYVEGSCVLFAVTSQVVCDIVAQGGCIAPPSPTPAPACAKPEFIAGMPLPEFEVGQPANHAIAWKGDTPYVTQVLIKPSWMTITVTGNVAVLTGTPLDDAAINFQMAVSNACGSAEINTRVCYCEQAGVQ